MSYEWTYGWRDDSSEIWSIEERPRRLWFVGIGLVFATVGGVAYMRRRDETDEEQPG